LKRALAFALVLCISVSVIVVVLVTRSTTSSFVTVYIRSDGAVSPSSEPIKRVGNVYNLTGNINGSIVVQRNNSVIDGNGYALQKTEIASLRSS
jgi:predicted small secreted protein